MVIPINIIVNSKWKKKNLYYERKEYSTTVVLEIFFVPRVCDSPLLLFGVIPNQQT